MSIVDCQTFLLTLQESDEVLLKLFCSDLEFEIINPQKLGPSWQEAQEIHYSSRQIYAKEEELLKTILDLNEEKSWQKSLRKHFSKLVKFRDRKAEKLLDLVKIHDLNLTKNLEVLEIYWQYVNILDNLIQLQKLKVQTTSQKKLFFGQNLTTLVTDFQDYIAKILQNINSQEFKLKIDDRILSQINYQNLPSNFTSIKQIENAQKSDDKWQYINCPTELLADLDWFSQQWQPSQQFENESKNLSENTFGRNLLDFEQFSIVLQQQKFELAKKLNELDFEINSVNNLEHSLSTSSVENLPKMTAEQKLLFIDTFTKIQIEKKLNFYRFQTQANLPESNYTKSQIIIAKNDSEQDLSVSNSDAKKSQNLLLSFLILSFPKNQTQLFFDLIKPYKVAFVELIPPDKIIHWQIKTPFLDNIAAKSNLAPSELSEDPSQLFWQLLLINVSLATADFGNLFFYLPLFLLFFRYKVWREACLFLGFFSSFLGILAGIFWTNLLQTFQTTNNFFQNNLWQNFSNYFTNFQIVNFWDENSKAPFNQLFGLNSVFKLGVSILIYFLIFAFSEFLWTIWLQRKFRKKSSNRRNLKLLSKISFVLYLILAIILSTQLWMKWQINQNVTNLFGQILAHFGVFVCSLLASLWLSLQINKYFLLPRFYQPTATKLKVLRKEINQEIKTNLNLELD